MDDKVLNRTCRNLVSRYGIAAGEINARYDDDLRGNEIVISSGPLSSEQVETVRLMLQTRGRVVFTEPANASAWRRLEQREVKVMARARAQALRREEPGLPVFEPAAGDLAAFVHGVEQLWGYEPGSVTEVRGSTIIMRPRDLGRSWVRLNDILSAGTIDADGVKIVMIGSIAEGEIA